MKKKYFFITFVVISTLFIFNACGIEDTINDIIAQVKNSLRDALDEQEKSIADFRDYAPPVTEDYVGDTPYSGLDYDDLSEEEQRMMENFGGGQPGSYSVNAVDKGGPRLYRVNAIGADTYDIMAGNLEFAEYSDLLFAPLSSVRQMALSQQINEYNEVNAGNELELDNTSNTVGRLDSVALSAEEEATVQSFIKNAIATENFLAKRKAASLLQEHTYNINGILFTYVFQKLLVEKGGVPADATITIDADFIDAFKSHYMTAMGHALPSQLALAGGIIVPAEAIERGLLTIQVKLGDIVKYDFAAQGVENMYDIRISSQFTMTVGAGDHAVTFGGENHIAAVFFKFGAAKGENEPPSVTDFKFVFRSPMTNIWDYSELLIHDLATGEFTSIRQTIEKYEVESDGGNTIQDQLGGYFDSNDYVAAGDNDVVDYFPVLRLFTAKFKKDGADAFKASVEYKITGIKPLSGGIKVDTNGALDSNAHPELESLQVKGFIKKDAPAAVVIKQFAGANVYGYNIPASTFTGRIDIAADGSATNFQDDGTGATETHRERLRDLDGDDEDVAFTGDIAEDQEYKDMSDYKWDEGEDKVHKRPAPNVHQGMDSPLKVYAGSPEIYLYFNINVEEDDFDPREFTITRGEANEEVTFDSVGVDDNGISNFLVFILADSEALPELGEQFTVTAAAGAITIKGDSNSESISATATVQSLEDRPHE